MTAARIDTAAALRGTAVGALTAALAVAAHGVAGGGMPGGAVAAQLVVLAATLGTVAATLSGAHRMPVLWGLLGADQPLHSALSLAVSVSHRGPPARVPA